MKLVREFEKLKPADAGISATSTMYPSELFGMRTEERFTLPRHATAYGYVLDGGMLIAGSISETPWERALIAGDFFSIPSSPDEVVHFAVTGRAAFVVRHGFIGQHVVGHMDWRGRLSYIDGCSDTILIYPPRAGDPVFNHLHFPPGVTQTQHTHPTIRFGIVVRGRGVAFGPLVGGARWEQPLEPGNLFLIEEHEIHSFKTEAEGMDVLAYHPDSDWGPSDENHPMLNRTYIGGR